MAVMLVIDASVAMRWLAQSQSSEMVDALFDDAVGNGGETLLVAPALILIEVHHALAKLWNRGLVTFPQFAEAQVHLDVALQIEDMDRYLLFDAAALSMSAETTRGRSVLARTLPFNIYDCVYISLAQRWKAELVTFDVRQADSAKAFGCAVRLL
jgi:predicted nucleic acid-binding protein